ncbi:MAG: hypothetical protein ABEN55_20765, partial [Bradymonadaceae bacterium]
MSRQVYPDTVEVRPFIEGVYFPYASSIQITDSPQRVMCQLEVPPSTHLRPEEMAGATLHIFYANKRVLQKEGKAHPNRPSTWPILFQGELAGEMQRESVQNRQTTLKFTSHTRHFEQTRLFHVHPERGNKSGNSLAAVDETKIFMGNTEISFEYSQYTKATQLWTELYEVIKNIGQASEGRNIAYGESILRIMRMAIKAHPIFSIFNNRLKLDQRFAAYADPDLKTLVGLKTLQKVFNKRAQQLPTFAPLMQFINIINNICKYQFNHIAQPKLRRSDNKQKRAEANEKADTLQNFNAYKQYAQEIAQYIQRQRQLGKNIHIQTLEGLEGDINFRATRTIVDGQETWPDLPDTQVPPQTFAKKV